MTTLKFIVSFLSIALYSCGQNSAKRKIDPSVTSLSNKIIPYINHLDNPDSCKKALSYLDSATSLDNNCFLCYYNKLMFLTSLNQYDKAVVAINNCIRITPYAHDLYLQGGILYEKIGDTISSRNYFEKSLTICNNVLDTMNVSNRDYEMLIGNKAVNLIMLDNQLQAKEILKKLYDSQTDPDLKRMTLSMMNKNKKELLESMLSDQYSRLH
jgi:tetratricopeptide (TPR) repeat protein